MLCYDNNLLFCKMKAKAACSKFMADGDGFILVFATQADHNF